ncbi:hypothetical protein BOTBODRAFT_166049 [Botryobasidium botryosum FD-172 SS1]|uniref:MULE transposase domain-containing protein n=1 Tax=Botryobasidium botryosum (strain FD-172 SS1) TaxID=930990 RepID=A0A067LY96_BOTB1|nr:hypothetical protein BOTBODRAFT_166049 [Botryobasidium botryosum FD-172 SS1]
MASFECQSQVTICIADTTPHYADITVRHREGHVPYCDVSLPEDVKDLVRNSLDKTPVQIWREIIQKHPDPISFNHKQVYQLWYSLVRIQWTLDVDEVRSAKKLLSGLGKDPKLGSLTFDRVDIDVPDGLSALAFSVPIMLEKWGARIREVALDSAWGTNRGGYEIFALLGEAYGSGLPLGYLLVKTVDKAVPNSKKRVLEQFLAHFRDEHELNVKFTLSDKDFAEIGACRTVFPKAKHQLCFWHCLKAIKKRLSILRRQPAHYNWVQAKQEFGFIDQQFVPVAQRPDSAPVSKSCSLCQYLLTYGARKYPWRGNLFHPKRAQHHSMPCEPTQLVPPKMVPVESPSGCTAKLYE